MCQHRTMGNQYYGHHGHGCGCRHAGSNHGFHTSGGHGHFQRHFLTGDEQVRHLENYKKELETEIKAVDEAIKRLKAE